MKVRGLAAGTTFLGAVFVLGPFAMVELNGILGWTRWSSGVGRAAGCGLMFAGIVTVAYCSGLFWRIGAGTPVPVEPPKHMVITGLYRYSRNPMYVAQAAILLGLPNPTLPVALELARWGHEVALSNPAFVCS